MNQNSDYICLDAGLVPRVTVELLRNRLRQQVGKLRRNPVAGAPGSVPTHLPVILQKTVELRLICQIPTAQFDAARRRMEVCRIQPRHQKVSPIKRRDFIQGVRDVIERASLDHRPMISESNAGT